MGVMDSSDEFDEVDVTEDEFDAMMATGEAVAVVALQPLQVMRPGEYTVRVTHGGGFADVQARRAVSVRQSTTGSGTYAART